MKKSILTIMAFSAFSCGNSDNSPLMKEFAKLSPETREFFNANAKVQCSCLKQHRNLIEKMLGDNAELLEALKSKKVKFEEEKVQKQLGVSIYPVLAQYNNCNAAAPQPKPESLKIIEKDLIAFSALKIGGTKSENILRDLGTELLKKHCKDMYRLGSSLDGLTTVISPAYGQK